MLIVNFLLEISIKSQLRQLIREEVKQKNPLLGGA